jgi:hypothetical protein
MSRRTLERFLTLSKSNNQHQLVIHLDNTGQCPSILDMALRILSGSNAFPLSSQYNGLLMHILLLLGVRRERVHS